MYQEARSHPGRGLGTPVSFTARCSGWSSPLWPGPLPGAGRAEVVVDLLPKEPEEGDSHRHKGQEVEPEQVEADHLEVGIRISVFLRMLGKVPVAEEVKQQGDHLWVAHGASHGSALSPRHRGRWGLSRSWPLSSSSSSSYRCRDAGDAPAQHTCIDPGATGEDHPSHKITIHLDNYLRRRGGPATGNSTFRRWCACPRSSAWSELRSRTASSARSIRD